MPAARKAQKPPANRIVVAVTGATGACYAVRLLEELRAHAVETHLLVSTAGWLTIDHELGMPRKAFEQLASVVHNIKDVGASIASGSFSTGGMVIAPCSMKTLSAVAHGYSDSLITRAADVTLKERRRLLLLTRECPLNLAHLRNMVSVTEMGGIILPPQPAFYQHPKTVEDIVDHSVGKCLELLGFTQELNPQWVGRR